MLVLALDTATTRITVGLVELPDGGGAGSGPRTLGRVDGEGARAHAELLAPGVATVLDRADATGSDLDAVVCGLGPGPFTGLRVGLVTAAALGDGLGCPVHGVGTHDALLHDAPPVQDPSSGTAPGTAPAGTTPPLALAVTDARRREVYWALGRDGRRVEGPAVTTPADLAAHLEEVIGMPGGPRALALGDAARVLADLVPGLVVVDQPGPTPAALVALAADDLRARTPPGPLVPLYLRRPDAVPPGAPKTVRR